LAGDKEGTGDFAYRISPPMVLIDVCATGAALKPYEGFGLDAAVMGVTRSIDLDAYDEPCVLGGSGRLLEG
jgi:hypothetical protein